MAIKDIISEEIETSTPNMEIAQGGPEDFMTDDEMDPYQDPEFQQLLDSLPGEQAEVLMQLIKEFKAMVAQGFEGEFEDFVKMKMASAQGGPEEFMSEEEMTISPEEQQSIIPMGQQVAQGGRIGYQNAGPVGGIMDVVEEEQVETGPTSQQLIMKWLNDRGLPITPENIQRAIIEMITGGMPYTEEASYDMPQMDQPSVLPKGMMVDETIIDRTPSGIATLTEDVITPPIKPMIYDAPIDEPWDTPKSTMFAAEGGSAGEGNQMAEDAINEIITKFYERFPGAAEETSLEDMIALMQAEGVFETEGLGILGLDDSMDMITPQSVRASIPGVSRRYQEGGPVDDDEEEYSAYVAEKQAAGEEYMDFDTYKLFKIQFPMAAGGRVPYGLGSLVKKIFKPIKKIGSKLVKSVKKFAKSDLGKAALMYMATAGASSLGAGKGMGSLLKAGTYNPMTVGSNIKGSWGALKNMFTPAVKTTDSSLLSDVVKQGLAADDKKALVKAGYNLSNLGTSQPSGLM